MRARKKRNKAKQIGRGRPRLYGPRIVLALPEGRIKVVGQALAKGETRQDFIRTAVDAELKRRNYLR